MFPKTAPIYHPLLHPFSESSRNHTMKVFFVLSALGLASAHTLNHYSNSDGGQCKTADRLASDSAYSSYTGCLKNIAGGWYKPQGCNMKVQLFDSTDCSGSPSFTYTQMNDNTCTSTPTRIGAQSAKGICV